MKLPQRLSLLSKEIWQGSQAFFRGENLAEKVHYNTLLFVNTQQQQGTYLPLREQDSDQTAADILTSLIPSREISQDKVWRTPISRIDKADQSTFRQSLENFCCSLCSSAIFMWRIFLALFRQFYCWKVGEHLLLKMVLNMFLLPLRNL